jgi:hypothetical protein
MLLQEIKEQSFKLSTSDRLSLIAALIQSLQNTDANSDWQYLVKREHSWRKQLYVKGHDLLASTVWQDKLTNQMSYEEAADNWDLPLTSIYEVVQYCESHRELLKLEADEEQYRLSTRGVSFELKTAA